MIYISVLDKVQQINHKETLSRKKCRKFLKAKTKCVDTFLRFHIIKSQVSRCYLRRIVMSLHKPCYWLTALERLWTVEQILAFSLASCRAHIHGNPFSDGARYSAQWFSLGEPSTHVWKTLHRQRGKHSAQWIQGAKVTAHVSRHKLKH